MRKALQHLKQADPVLATIIDRAGPYTIHNIVGQALSSAASGET